MRLNHKTQIFKDASAKNFVTIQAKNSYYTSKSYISIYKKLMLCSSLIYQIITFPIYQLQECYVYFLYSRHVYMDERDTQRYYQIVDLG